MDSIGAVRRRIEDAEVDLKAAKNELTRLESVQDKNPYVTRASAYLNSMACHHHISDDGTIITIEAGYTWNTKGFDEAIHPANASITGYKIRFMV